MRGKTTPVCLLVLAFAAAARLSAADARGAYLEGTRAQASEDYAGAVERYKEALAQNPAYLEATVGLAEAFFLLEEYDEANRFMARARLLDRNNLDLAVLEGRIRIGQGNVAAARTLFQGVLSVQPNNLEARLGIAEADIAEGRTRDAVSEYSRTLRLAPESRKALLSLAMLSDELGDSAGAARYYELSLKNWSSDPQVQLAAAGWYAGAGDLASAEKHAKIALSLSPSLDRARIQLGQIFLRQGRPAEAVGVLREVVASSRDNPLAWYALGTAYRQSGDAAKAISSFASGLSVRPEDEIARIARENTALDSLPLGDAERTKAAAFHLAQGKALEERNYLERALGEYRRALVLDPTASEARVAYARVYKRFGFPGKYLSELQVLARLGSKDPLVLDEVEALASERADTVSRLWGYDQYNLERRRYTIPVFTLPARNRFLHPLADEDLARSFAFQAARFDSIAVPEGRSSVAGFDEAFRGARGSGSDYFVVLGLDESERSFTATADLYLSRTGARIGSFAVFRTGNDRIRDSFQKICEQIATLLPARGTLLVRKFDQGLVDIGTFQGLKKGDVLVIVRGGSIRLDAEKPGLAYDEKDVVGDFTVTNPDEGVAEGVVAQRGYFDYVNPGDEVTYPVRSSAKPEVPAAQKTGNILSRLFRIGG